MGIELHGDEGEVTVIDYSAAAEVTTEEATTEANVTEEVAAETTQAEQEAINEVVEEMTTEPVDDSRAGETEVYSEEEVVELMKIHEQKIIEEIERQKIVAAEPVRTEEKPTVKAPSELVAGTLDEVLSTVGDEDLVSGKDIKEILKKSFAALNHKAEEFNTTAEAQKFDAAAKLYAEKYVPNIVQNYKLDPASRDARFIQSSFLETLTQAMHRFGRTEAAAKAAATQHMLNMSKEFGEVKPTTVAAKPAVTVERKLTSGNTGSEPVKVKTTGVDPSVIAKVEKGTASTAQLLKLINARKSNV